MRRHFSFTLILITENNMVVVYWKPLVGIDGDTEETRILNCEVKSGQI